MEILKAVDIKKKFEAHQALSGVSISCQEGTIFGLLGPNGAGKTTLIRIINQITAPDSGEVFFNGEKLQPEHIKQIGYLPEERGLYKKMKTGEQALYFARLKGMSKHDAMERLKFQFEKFDIMPWWNKKVEELSKGMAQKVQFITTILHQPKLLIFDEPFSGFDPINANLLKSEILALKENGASIIFSTHNMASAEEICDRIALINNSKKILDGEINEVKNNFKTNTYEISFEGKYNKFKAALTADYEILNSSEVSGNSIVNVRMKNPANSNFMLKTMTDCGKVASFKEVIPSINDIFIQAISNEKDKDRSTEEESTTRPSSI